MEVQAQSIPPFDLQSKPPFSYPLNLEIDSSDLHSHEMARASEYGVETSALSNGRESSNTESLIATSSDAGSPIDSCREPFNFESLVDMVTGSESAEISAHESASLESKAAVKLQKVYRSYRTRRRLADSAVVAELWWQAIDFVRQNHNTISFFDFEKPETAASRWYRVSHNASKVGRGLSEDARAQKLAFQHWIEAIDPRHRYGHNLHFYYEEWSKADAGQPFFYWLDIGDGKEADLKVCPRSKLRQQCIKYLGPQEREHYEYIFDQGKVLHKQSGDLLDTSKGLEGAKWIFVVSASKNLYAGEKKKGVFHHSSFLAGGATLAAGRLNADHGVLTCISAYSGHYRPNDENLSSFLSLLKENEVNLDEVQIRSSTEDYEYEDGKSVEAKKEEDGKSVEAKKENAIVTDSKPLRLEIPSKMEEVQPCKPTEVAQTEVKGTYKRTLSGGLQSPTREVPQKAILKRINSKKVTSSYQLGNQLSLKWSTGAGPRIGCVADYPLELRVEALEFVNLSPRVPPSPSITRRLGGIVSPTSCLTPSNLSSGGATTGATEAGFHSAQN